MFIHWGLYSIPAHGEWVMYNEAIPADEYALFAKQFNPGDQFKVKEWIDLAVQGGAKYVVLTSRHHEGFCLWDSQTTDYTAPKTIGRDFVAEYVQAVRDAGLKVGLYYSLLDWRIPAYWHGPRKDPQGWAKFVDMMHAQVNELTSNYGKLDILWYDGFWPNTREPRADAITAADWRSNELNAMVRRNQPEILINDRSMEPEDFGTPEQEIIAQGRPWEACLTVNDNWGYHSGDRNWKTPRECLGALVRSVSMGGNLILNIGPHADGTVPADTRLAFEKVGEWLKRQGESVYGCGQARYIDRNTSGGYYCSSGVWTGRDEHTVYFHTLRWTGPRHSLRMEEVKVKKVSLLLDGKSLPFEQRGDRCIVSGLPVEAPDELDTVLKFELE
jgi:alpha-L-fucosidase